MKNNLLFEIKEDDFYSSYIPSNFFSIRTPKPTLLPILESKSQFDDMLDYLDLTNYHIKVYLIMTLFLLSDGCEMVVLSLVSSKMSEEWNLSTSQKGIMGSSVFIGFFIGSLISGKISDFKGRKPTFKFGSLTVLIFSSIAAFSNGYKTFILLRALCGVGIGVSLPAIFCLATEISPSKYRSIVLTAVWAAFAFGEVFVIILSNIFINTSNGWRYIIALSSIPCLIVFIFSFYVQESPRYYLANSMFNEAFEGIMLIIDSSSSRKFFLTEAVKTRLIKEANNIESNKIDVDFSLLLSQNYMYLSILIWVIFYCCSFVYYGVVFILPQIMEKESMIDESLTGNDIFWGLIISALSEIPGFLFAGWLADLWFLGRLKSMAIGFIVSAISAFGAYFYPNHLTIFMSILKLAMALPFNIITLYSCEAYPTKFRTMAVGVANSFTRFGGITTPFISQILFALDYRIPFFAYGLVSVAGALCVLNLPFETNQRRIE